MKTQKSISFDYEVITESRLRRLNLSNLCNEYMRNYLEIKTNEKEGLSKNERILILKSELADLEKQRQKEIKKIKKNSVEIINGVRYVNGRREDI